MTRVNGVFVQQRVENLYVFPTAGLDEQGNTCAGIVVTWRISSQR